MELNLPKNMGHLGPSLVATSCINHHLFFNGLGGNLSSSNCWETPPVLNQKMVAGGRLTSRRNEKMGLESGNRGGGCVLVKPKLMVGRRYFPFGMPSCQVLCYFQGGQVFFRLDPSIAGNLSKRVVLCNNFVKFVVFVGVQMWPHMGFFISLQKISLFFYRKRHLYKSTAANDILHKDNATLWHILLAPGGTEPWICFCV